MTFHGHLATLSCLPISRRSLLIVGQTYPYFPRLFDQGDELGTSLKHLCPLNLSLLMLHVMFHVNFTHQLKFIDIPMRPL